MSDAAVADIGLLDRALRRVSALWRDMAASVAGAPEAGVAARLEACLNGRGGDVARRSRAAGLAEAYLGADGAGRLDFLRALASLDSDPAAVQAAMAEVASAADAAGRASAKARLRRVLEPPRLRLLTQFTSIPDGQKFLVDLRADLLGRMGDDPLLRALETDLRQQLAAWFDVGFLELRRIDWQSPAALLEKLVGYEAVHRIRTWRDLKNRLDSDRRCYAFFHPRMPAEPLIFVEVALVQGMAASVQALLNEKAPVLDPKLADTAVFYSINNCQRGLDGISLGNFLIKRVVELLSAEFRNLKTFATLSPVPGFRRWLEDAVREESAALLTPEESASLAAALPEAGSGTAPLTALLRLRHPLAHAVATPAEPVLTRLCARYILQAGDPRRPQRACDPVAHFHLSNGARVERLNWRADVSDKGVRESFGLMVNYVYDPARIEDNHEEYVGAARRPAATAFRRLVRG
jgi:malonyl-CoA decarboxylase